MSRRLDAYLGELHRELLRCGVLRTRLVEEVRGHVLDAAEAAGRGGMPAEAAIDRAIERFGPAGALAVEFALERSRIVQRVLFGVAISLGLLIGYLDSRPSWDDTGISAGLVLISSAILGALGPNRAWLLALGIGVWIPVFGLVKDFNFGSLIALAVAFAGASVGKLVRRAVIPT